MYKRILVTTDGSTLSKKAVRSAIDLAVTLDAELVALHVIPRFPQSFFDGGVAISPSEVEIKEKQWNDGAEKLLGTVHQSAAASGVKAKTVVVQSGVVSDAILRTAKKHKCDLIVMASHGRAGIKRVLLGSETQQVLTHSDIPTLVLR